MKATDERVSYMKEILGILRMVKIFGWESRVSCHEYAHETPKLIQLRSWNK